MGAMEYYKNLRESASAGLAQQLRTVRSQTKFPLNGGQDQREEKSIRERRSSKIEGGGGRDQRTSSMSNLRLFLFRTGEIGNRCRDRKEEDLRRVKGGG